MHKIAINGFGRIGRVTLRRILKTKNLEVVAINDLTHPSTLAYLLKYDTVHGTLEDIVDSTDTSLIINGKTIRVYAEKDPSNIPWKKDGVELVLECTGIFSTREKAAAHLKAGVKKVIISQPSDLDMKTVVFNVNQNILQAEDQIISVASCTTNCLAPLAKVLHDAFEIRSGFMTTIHAFTNSQPLVDTPDRKNNLRASRAAAGNIVPYTTGAAKAMGLVIPDLQGKLDGSSQRVPVMTGSVTEFYTKFRKEVTAQEVNAVISKSTNETLGYTADMVVSSDIVGITFGSLFDATQTKVIGKGDDQIVKTAAWYDNEMSFVSQMVRTALYFADM